MNRVKQAVDVIEDLEVPKAAKSSSRLSLTGGRDTVIRVSHTPNSLALLRRPEVELTCITESDLGFLVQWPSPD